MLLKFKTNVISETIKIFNLSRRLSFKLLEY